MVPVRGVTVADADALRRTPGATVVLFLTDRCPVGCAHCSVSSRADSPTITDWDLFTEIVAGLCALPDLQVVAITGGEPFAERRGLDHAVRRLADAGKAVVLFTSGHWARPVVPAWIGELLALTSTVYLSTDSLHAARLRRTGDARFPRAVEAVTAAGCHLVLQVLDEPGAYDAARALSASAEIRVIPSLPIGRGATVFPAEAPGSGRCSLTDSPTVRYDGRVTACCHEAVIMGAGPAGLHRWVADSRGVADALGHFRQDPVLRLIGRYGPAALATVVDGTPGTPCRSCWAAHERVAADRTALVSLTILSGGAR